MPREPAPSPWVLPDPAAADGDVVGVGADLEPGTILAAYRHGLFPMPLDLPVPDGDHESVLAWWSPDPRGVLPLDGLRVSRSLRKSCARFEIRIDTATPAVIDACGDPSRPHGWITDEIRHAYVRLHEMGWVHSVEAWSLDDGALAGGLYGVAIGGLFAGESMFHRRTDASKVALVALVELLRDGGATLLDVQWRTDHLASLGVVEISRRDYLARLRDAVARPLPGPFLDDLRGRGRREPGH
ncbi:MAG TPA: leucyl/phenylalanyl-tRNA--protein transferase [Acidimicrobiales bacterium]|nr:leucyl/phenylalanyl-tRNA--protein transferase [Acidimicrobiales bacterium]